jgi:glycosyltransferase involved in cell wall biosynthesis
MTDLSIRGLIAALNGIGTAEANGASRRASFKLRRMGDRCRNRRNWRQAKEYYSRYLEIVPGDAAIWVQYGHSCKELGDPDAAEAAYRKSAEIMPGGDAYVSLGQVLKSKGDSAAADAAFRKAITLAAGIELGVGLDGGKTDIEGGLLPAPGGGAAALPKRVLIDLSDVFFFLHHHNTVSGIQRVQLGLAEALLRIVPELPYKLAFVCTLPDDSGWLEIDNPHLEALVERMSAPVVAQEDLRELLSRITGDALPYQAMAGDLFLILGAFWIIDHLAPRIPKLRRAGAAIGALIYDLIPLTHPEFVVDALTNIFQFSVDALLPEVDLMMAISDHTARTLRDYLAERGFPMCPVVTLKLAHRALNESSRSDLPRSPVVAALSRRPYILYTSTIEVRKNHLYLFQIWKRLLRDLHESTPTLVFAGREGWGVGDLLEQLKRTNFLQGKIQIIHGLSDPELAELYRHCLFTVYPSFEEGWGLPIGESLAFGRPCLASETSSLPEVAGDFADYLDPYNITDGYEKIKRFIVDGGFRETRAAAIKTRFKPRLWRDVAQDLLRTVEKYANEPRIPYEEPEPPVLQPGVLYRMGHGGDFSRFARSRASLVRAICGMDWYGIEEWGRWMRGYSAWLHFRLAENASREIVLAFELRTAPGFHGLVQVTIDDLLYDDLALEADATERLVARIKPKGQNVRIDFATTDQITVGGDPRPLSIGIRSIAYAPLDDLAARVNLLEMLSARLCTLRPSSAPEAAGAAVRCFTTSR